MRRRFALAWCFTLLLGSLAGVLMYTGLREPPPTEVRPIEVWQDRSAGRHSARSGDESAGGRSQRGRGAAILSDRAGGGGAPDPTNDRNSRGGGVPDLDDAGGVGEAPDTDEDAGGGGAPLAPDDAPDSHDRSGGGGRAADPDDAPDPDHDQGGGGDNDDSRDDGGGDGD